MAAAVAAAASPAPPRASAYRDHPTYKYMILQAVADLKERKGSSRRSIAKHIAANFSDLPKTHDALLSTHIRRLRKRGLLVMVRHSYTFPRPDVDAGAQSPKPRRGGRRKYGELLSSSEGFSPKSERNLETSRRPGRPRKAGATRVSAPGAPKRRPGRPPRVSASGVAPVLKRRPGRPPRSTLLGKRRPGRPPKIPEPGEPPVLKRRTTLLGKRRPGRPPKIPEPGEPPVLKRRTTLLGKRRPGRPPKIPEPGEPPVLKRRTTLLGKRRPGRPPKIPEPGEPHVLKRWTTLLGKRKPGRPPKIPEPGEPPVLKRRKTLLGKRRPGRPPKIPERGEPPVLKRRPGRPPKLTVPGLESPGKSRSRRPPKNLVADTPPARKSRLGRPLKALVLGEPPAEKRRLPSSAKLVRKPGRPRKNVDIMGFRGSTALSEPSAAAIGVTEKRKPGRPRNVPQSAAVSVYRNNASRVVLIMPKRLKPSSDPLLHATANTPMNKRRPGRPKKDSAVPSSSAAAVNLLLGKRKRGRPVKPIGNVEPGHNSMPTGVSGSIGRKKPGRPRKVSPPLPSAKAINGTATSPDRLNQLAGIAIGETETDLGPVPAAAKALVEMRKGGRSEVAIESVEKRKMGRPKKGQTNTSSILEVNANASLDLAQPPSAEETAVVRFGPDQMPAVVTTAIKKRKPGRPRKVLAPSSALAEENGGVPSTKRRGRPPKRSSFF